MRQKLTWFVLFGAAIAVMLFSYSGHVWATAANGFMATTLAKGTLGPFEVFNHSILPNPTGDGDNDSDHRNVWLSFQKTKGSSDLYVQSNVWQAGGSTGWHSHPGHSLITVTAGAVTDYESDDPECKPHVYTQGMSFVDSGGSHVHIIRNEGTVLASTIAVQLIPAGATRRIDAATAPANCPNIQ
jgi:quercetin dioxygenase-like cupin family protein